MELSKRNIVTSTEEIFARRDLLGPEEQARADVMILQNNAQIALLLQRAAELVFILIKAPELRPRKEQLKKKFYGKADVRGLISAELANKALKE